MTSDPAKFPRRVLLAITGLSPQVVTETVFALSVLRQPPFVPTAVHAVTTSHGEELIRQTLLPAGEGRFRRLCEDYSLAGIDFQESFVHPIRDAAGRPLADVRTESDNQSAADHIAFHIRQFTSCPDTALHVSIAGGRKTLGFFAGSALSLFGRPQDRLSHVLVSEGLEADRNFFYPPLSPRDGTLAGQVVLADIPFVRLRHWIPEHAAQASYAEAVEETQQRLDSLELVIDLPAGRISAGARELQLPFADAAFLLWLARRKKTGLPPVRCPSDGAPEPAYAREYLRCCADANPAGAQIRTEGTLRRGMEKSFFLERRSRLHRKMREQLGAAAENFFVRALGKRPETRYELAVDPAHLHIRRGN